MKQITLEKLNAQNWEACANLELHEAQKNALPSNIISIAELNFYPATKAFAIKHNDEVIGFATYGKPDTGGNPKLFRLMIGKQYQGKGFGKTALRTILENMFQEYACDVLGVCYEPNNELIKGFYASVGFEEKEILPSKIRKEGKVLAVLNKENFV